MITISRNFMGVSFSALVVLAVAVASCAEDSTARGRPGENGAVTSSDAGTSQACAYWEGQAVEQLTTIVDQNSRVCLKDDDCMYAELTVTCVQPTCRPGAVLKVAGDKVNQEREAVQKSACDRWLGEGCVRKTPPPSCIAQGAARPPAVCLMGACVAR
jgi:hypothetical protein